MTQPPTDREAFAQRGEEYYDRALRSKLEPKHIGKYLVLDVETGDYEVDSDEMAALDRAGAKHPDSFFYILRVGFPTAGRIGVQHPSCQP